MCLCSSVLAAPINVAECVGFVVPTDLLDLAGVITHIHCSVWHTHTPLGGSVAAGSRSCLSCCLPTPAVLLCRVLLVMQIEYYYITAANQLQRPYVRCVVIGDSNRSVEGAHELGMKSVIVTGNQPAWNFSGADLVVRNLSQLSFVNMKKLFGNEDLVEAQFDDADVQPLPQPEYL